MSTSPRRPWRAAACALACVLGAVQGAGPARAADAPPGSPAPTDGGACARAVAQAVQTHYDAVRDLSARFEQRTASAAFPDAAQVARGRVVFAKPGRMRWEYESPTESTVVSDGETLWLWDPGLGEAQKLPVTQGFLSGAAMEFLLGEGRLLDAFEPSAESCEGELVWLELAPREPATYQTLSLRARRATGEVVETGILDLLGNRVQIAFRDVEINTDPPASTFRFEPPEGARVLEIPPTP